MSLSDPIADMLTRIRNAQLVKKKRVNIPFSRMKKSIAQVLKDEGYIDDFSIEKNEEKQTIEISLKYYAGKSVIENIKRISKPGLRIYSTCKDLPVVMNGLGITIVSTSSGVMTEKKAKIAGIGGELICCVS